MDAISARLECLKLACVETIAKTETVKTAETYAAFVLGPPHKESSGKNRAGADDVLAQGKPHS